MKRFLHCFIFLSIVWSILLFSAASAEGGMSPLAGKLVINELMVKNHATFADADGDAPDWVELKNVSDEPIALDSLGLSDKEYKVFHFSSGELAPGGILLVCADKKDGEGHVDFAVSKGETIRLTDGDGLLIDSVKAESGTADLSLARGEDGKFSVCSYPSPGFENSGAGYDAWQDTLYCDSPLILSEVMVYNNSLLKQSVLGCCDWVELKNVSDAPLSLSDYCLSDDDDNYELFPLPDMTLGAGRSVLVLCSAKEGKTDKGCFKAPFELDSERERLYLSRGGKVVDRLFIHDVPYGCTFGRLPEQNGAFYFDRPTPGEDNKPGYRRVSATPESLLNDGVYNDCSSVIVELAGKGDIYYATDASLLSLSSQRYTGAFEVTKTCVVKAISVEPGCLPSRPLVLNYILNENHSLPVVSLTADDPNNFTLMYNGGKKDIELPGSLSFYEEGGSFTVPCGIDMHGETSLSLKKKNMGIHLRGVYGQEALDYDLFGGGVTHFSGFVLRAGQDQSSSVIRSELFENLCLQYSDAVLAQRSRYVVLYVNGEYRGIYALMEKLNEKYYANYAGVSSDSVTVLKSPTSRESAFYKEVVDFAKSNDLRSPEVYAEFCRRLDIDSLIDWIIIEGFSGNSDINPGNVRYCRSTENDGRWRHMLYDLDSTFVEKNKCYANILGQKSAPYYAFVGPLLQNDEFRERLLRRAGEVYASVLTDENVLAEIDRLSTLIAPEIERNNQRFGIEKGKWDGAVRTLREKITNWSWRDNAITALCGYCKANKADYFN